MIREINFDGLIGPSHNYAALSLGNLASARQRLSALPWAEGRYELRHTDARRFGKLARPQQSGTLYRIKADGSDSR